MWGFVFYFSLAGVQKNVKIENMKNDGKKGKMKTSRKTINSSIGYSLKVTSVREK